ncbi:MAG: AsmA family protein [Caldimonas sp.]
MRHPLAAWRAGSRWPAATLAAILVLLLVLGACEALGWPFLVAPMQNWLAKTLDRRVELSDGSGGQGGVRIRLLGGLRISAAQIEIGSPAWSQEPHMLLARDARLALGYFDLWRAWRGQPLRVQGLEAAELDGALERRSDGKASWQFGRKGGDSETDTPQDLPSFGRLRVGDGHLAYNDEVVPARIDARFALSDGSVVEADAASAPASGSRGIVVRAGAAASGASAAAPAAVLAPGESGLRLNASGEYRKLPVRIELRTAGVLGLLEPGRQAEAQPVRLIARIGRAELSFEGSTTDPLHFAGLLGRFTLAGPSLAAVGDPLGITLPTTPAFRARGSLAKDGGLWKAVFDEATIGSSRLDGAFTYDRRPKVPLLAGRLGGSRLVLADLGPVVGAPAPGETAAAAAAGARIIPDRKFDLPSLRAMDANILIEIGMFDPGTMIIEPLRPVRGHLLLADGVLTIADFEGRTAQGRLAGFLQLDGRGAQALWTADLRALGVDLARWLRLNRDAAAPPYVSGKLDALMKVKGAGRSTAEILASLAGDIRLHLRDATVSHLVVEAGGLDIAQALGVMLKGDDALPILCNAIDLDVVDGVARPKVFVLDTRDSTIWIDGTVSLRSEALDLRAVVSPKDFSPLTLRSPIHVRGTLGKPAVAIEPGKLAGKAGAAALLSLLNPLAALIPFIDPGAQGAAEDASAQCASLVPTSSRIAAAVKTPKTLHVPPPPAAAPLPASAPRAASAASASR